MTETAIVQAETGGPLRPEDLVRQVTLVQEVMKSVMKDGEHYGKIPGCGTKPTLLQPGAQVLAFTFRLAPSFDIQTVDLPNLHREYVVTCKLASIQSGQLVGTGVGSCSTMESKYRYRNVADYKDTGEPIPDDYKQRKAEYRKQGYGAKQVDGVWCWVQYGDSGKVENPDIADTYNTVLKMATKRAFVHAVLNATAASDMFTQDVEDLPSMGAPEAVQPAKVRDTTLDALRMLRDEMEVAEDTYAAQVKHYGAESDADLTEEDAQRLIRQYELRRPKPVDATDEDIPF